MASLRPQIQLRPELSFLVNLAGKTIFEKGILPAEVYRPESVATAVRVAQGSTFAIDRQKVPKIAPYTNTLDMDGYTVSIQIKSEAPEDVEWIVYKVAQVEFTQEGQAIPDHRHRLAAVAVELLVLTHKPVQEHPFLPTLYGFVWAQAPYHTQQRIPVPIVDWANRGSLADFQSAARVLPEPVKRRIAWQIGSALQFLHECEIYHGDVKTENVLVHDTNNTLNAKLSDFGMSVVSEHGYLKYLPPGTLQWAAPEIRWPGEHKINLAKADTFSYGLLLWRLFCDGIDPLSSQMLAPINLTSSLESLQALTPNSRFDRPNDDEIQHLMRADRILERASSLEWLKNTTLIKWRVVNHIRSTWGILGDIALPDDATFVQQIMSFRIDNLRKDFLFLAAVFELSLCSSPERRSLRQCLELLEHGQGFVKPITVPSTLHALDSRRIVGVATDSVPTSWNAMRGIDPITRHLIMSQRLYKASLVSTQLVTSANLFLGNAACFVSGMGTDVYDDPIKGIEFLAIAARKGSLEAASLLYRVCSSFDVDVPEDVNYIERTYEAAYLGSASAFEDLKILASERVGGARYTLNFRTCGIGADFYYNHRCLNGWSFADREQLDWIRPILEQSDGHPQNIRVNQRGDNFLHAAVTLKHDFLFQLVLNKLRFDVDFCNHEGETPLLCAMRAGSITYVHQLLDRGADPCITSCRGETPLHWVLSSTKFGHRDIIDKIILKGGWQTITCWAKMPTYVASSLTMFRHFEERLCDGTPLHWAICRKKGTLIRLLVEKGAPLDMRGPDDRYHLSPLELAAYLHEAEILRYVIDQYAQLHVGSRAVTEDTVERQPPLQPNERPPISGGDEIIRSAIDGCERFNLVCRHGPNHKTYSRRTFSLLGKEFSQVSYVSGVDPFGRTPLQYAAYRGHDDAVKYILEYVKTDSDVNRPLEGEFWTPICDAIARDHITMFDLLLDNGASVHVLIDSPARTGARAWGTLHLAARFSISGRLDIPRRLIDMGVAVDGYKITDSPEDFAESPLSLAIENDAFDLADFLRQHGADVDAKSKDLMGGSTKLTKPTNILGRVIASNMRHSKHRLQYLLYPPSTAVSFPQVNFVIDPEDNVTALHWSLSFHNAIDNGNKPIDPKTRLDIFKILLERFDSEEEINAQTEQSRSTVLHIAVTDGLHEVVSLLVDNPGGADVSIRDIHGHRPVDIVMQKRDATLSQLREGRMIPPMAQTVLDIGAKMIKLLEDAAVSDSL